MRDFKSFTFWQDAVDLSAEICILTRKFPIEERYALGDQMRRASVSIVSNIAEGSGRSSDADFTHFMDIALGSAYEVEAQVYIAHKLRYINDDEKANVLNNLCSIQRRIAAFIKKVRGQ